MGDGSHLSDHRGTVHPHHHGQEHKHTHMLPSVRRNTQGHTEGGIGPLHIICPSHGFYNHKTMLHIIALAGGVDEARVGGCAESGVMVLAWLYLPQEQ